MPQFDERGTIASLAREFPEIVQELQEQSLAGLFYLEMGCFQRYLQRQIDAENRAEVARCYEWLRKLMLYGDSEVQNAVGVSVLEHLNTSDGKANRRWALESMPPILRQAYSELTRGIYPRVRERTAFGDRSTRTLDGTRSDIA